jgi:uncharacterized pyridoxamine 5'-phosphate oxidase family protein
MEKEQARKQALAFLKNNIVAVVATVGIDGVPEAATVHYVIDNNFTLYFYTKSNSRKAKNLQNNTQVAIVGTENIPMTVQLDGVASMMYENEETATIIDRLAKVSSKGYFPPPINSLAGDAISVYKIEPKYLQWLDARTLDGKEISPVQILP